MHIYRLGIGLVGLSTLLLLSGRVPWAQVGVPLAFFALLSLIVKRAGFHVTPGVTHSLVGIVDIAVMLLFGPLAGAAVTALTESAYRLLRAWRHQKRLAWETFEVVLFNAGLQVLVVLASSWLYARTGGRNLQSVRLGQSPGWKEVLPLCVLFVTWFGLDHLGWSIAEGMRSGLSLAWSRVRAMWRMALWVELLPLWTTVIIVFVYNQGNPFVFALLSGGIVAISIVVQQLADMWQQLRNRIDELTALSQAGQEIVSAQLDVDQLCELIYRQAGRIVDTSSFQLGLFTGDAYTLKIWVQNGTRQPAQTFPMAATEGIIGWMRRSMRPLLVRDFEREMASLPASTSLRPSYNSDHPPRSAVFVPLIAGDTAIGTMAIQSLVPAAFSQGHLRLLSVIANQAAMAIEKARLYVMERRRARQLALIDDVSRKVAAILDLETLFSQVVHLIQETFGYYHVGIFSIAPGSDTLVFEASTDTELRRRGVYLSVGQGIVGWAAQEGRPLLVNDVFSDPRFVYDQALPQTRAELAVPLKVEDRVLGVLDVQSDVLLAPLAEAAERVPLDENDLFILQTLAAQVAVAIENAHLYTAQQEEAWVNAALLQVAEATSKLSDLTDVLGTVVRLTPMLSGVDRCGIFLWSRENQVFVPAQAHGLTDEQYVSFATLRLAPADAPVLEQVHRTRSPATLTNADLASGLPPHMIEMFGICNLLVLPLLARGQVVGVMLVDYVGDTPRGTPQGGKPFTQHKVGMISGIANQAAIAIENAQLYAAQQEEAYVSTALLQVAEAVGSLTDLDEILSTIVRITPILVGVRRCAVLLWDEDEQAFVPVQWYGLFQDEQEWLENARLSQRDPLAQHILRGQPAVSVQDASQDRAEQMPKTLKDVVLVPGELPVLALPLAAKGHVLGAIVVDYVGVLEHFTERWMNILTGIANQAAIAIENTQLYLQEAGRQRLERELDLAREIQASFLPDQCPYLPGWELGAYWRSAYQVGGDFYDMFSLPDGRLGLVIADVADKGVPAALFMALSRTLLRVVAQDTLGPARVLQRTNDLMIADTRSDLFVTVFYAILDPESGLLTYASAGHNPPVLIRSNQDIELLQARGIVLGIVSPIQLEEKSIHLGPGDALVLYTDGVTDAIDAQEREFGMPRLIEIVQRMQNSRPDDIIAAVKQEVRSFVGNVPQFDDLTLVALKRAAHQEAGETLQAARGKALDNT